MIPDFKLLGITLAQHALGNRAESDAALLKLINDYGHSALYQIAQACAWRGEIDRAFEWIERAYTQRGPGITNVATDPFFRPLHNDARWLPFMRKMGFR